MNNFKKELKNFISEKPEGHWDFSFREKTELEKTFKYPAKMVSSMQDEILDFFTKKLTIKNVYDPFMGSGTIIDLAVQKKIKNIFGNDLNPYSYIINKSKFVYDNLDESLFQKDIQKIDSVYNTMPLFKLHYFNKINKWFKAEVIKELSKIRQIIYTEQFHYFNLLEIALMNTAKDFSNTRGNTAKLYIKTQSDVEKIDAQKIFSVFLKYFSKLFYALKNEINVSNNTNVYLSCQDSKNLNPNIKKNEIDLIVTSPPYGDNKTTISYGQFSILQLMWLNSFLGSDYEKNFSKIDSECLGGSLKETKQKKEVLKEVSQTFFDLSNKFEEKNSFKKVTSFLYDFYDSLTSLDQTLKDNGWIIFTLGNRHVSNIEIPLDTLTIEFIQSINKYSLVSKFKRYIPSKTIPRFIYDANKEKIKTMSEETVLIFNKNK